MDWQRRELLLGGVSTLALAGVAMEAAASAAGTGAVGSAAAGADVLKGPYLDLSTPRGNMLAVARMTADLDLTKQKTGWYNGFVSGVRAGEPVKDLFGFAGFGMARLLPHESGTGYRKVLREVGIYYDLKSGEPLEEFLNPYTSEKVRVVPVANDPFNTTIQEYFPPPPNYGGLNATTPPPKVPLQLPWKKQGDYITLERHIHLFYKNALQPDKWPRESAGPIAQVSEFFAHHVKVEDLQNEKITSLDYTGTWNRITPWLPWMLMGQRPGLCQYACFMGTTANLEEILSRNVLDYCEKNYKKYFDAPTEWSTDRSLSSLEHYAKDQKPAPVK